MSEKEDCSCKLGRISLKYDLESFEQELEERWRSPNGPGLRKLARVFNERVLRTAIEKEDEPVLDGEGENLYRLLTDDDVSAGVYTQAKNRLRASGVDPESLEADFISYQTINRHFKNCRELTKEKTETSSNLQNLKDRIFALQNRTVRVTENTLDQLDETVKFKERNVFIDITVSCEECGSVIPIEDAVDGSHCNCYE